MDMPKSSAGWRRPWQQVEAAMSKPIVSLRFWFAFGGAVLHVVE
jgi:hypothetical protein